MILTFIIFLFAVYLSFSFIKKIKHDRALFRFTALKYEVQLYMAKEFESFNQNDKTEFKLLLREINDTIYYYNSLKLNLFRFSTFKKITKDVISNLHTLESLQLKSKRIDEFRKKIGRAYLLAFTDLIFLFRVRALTYLFYKLSVLLCELKINKQLNFVYLWMEKATRDYQLQDSIKLDGHVLKA